MFTRRLLVAAIALPLALPAQDSTQAPKPKDSTLMEKMGLRGVHVSFGGGSAPYRGRTTGPASASELRLGFTPRAHSEWTVALTSSLVIDMDTAGYIAPGSSSYHPRMMETASGLEVQRRWHGTALLHPMAVVGAGQMSNAYNYYSYPKTGGSTFHSDEKSAASYVTAGAGGRTECLQLDAGRPHGRVPQGRRNGHFFRAGVELWSVYCDVARVRAVLGVHPSTAAVSLVSAHPEPPVWQGVIPSEVEENTLATSS